ncbi:uncharacterized protein LOC141911790 isoform X2 [Tubulanus polymorphus]|uniref:uncharacterized protein LOC141911790 isoform X2 n=1 Tax=Tubulanus polymorphus TaxID=672921 RepID=UPI003DA2815F
MAGVLYSVSKNSPDELNKHLRSKSLHSQVLLSRAILLAAENGYAECVSLLLQAGTPADTHTAGGYAPLHLAARAGHADVIKILVDANCNKERRVYRTFATALHWATARGHVDCMQVLLDAGCYIDSRTVHQQTPLMVAAINDEVDAMRLLIGRGAGLEAVDSNKATALQLAVKECNLDSMESLIESGADINHQDRYYKTPLHEAARAGHAYIVRGLLHAGACVLSMDAYGMTPLHYAAHFDNPTVVRVLIDEGGSDPKLVTSPRKYWEPIPFLFDNLEERFVRGMTAVMLACQAGAVASLGILLTYNDVITSANDIDDNDMNALLYACAEGNAECVDMLMRLTDVDPDGPFGYDHLITPLNLAIENSQLSCVRSLIRANCTIMQDHVRKAVVCGGAETLDAARLLVLAMRSPVSRDLLLVMTTDPACLTQKDFDEFLVWAEEFAAPRSLLQSSRAIIRDSLGRRVLNPCAIATLPLPAQLQRYLELTDLKYLFS